MEDFTINNKMDICFVSNFSKTLFFEQIAYGLQELNVNVYWITVDKYWYDYLCDRFDKKKILHLNKKCKLVNNEPVGDFKINEIILSDRVLNVYKDTHIVYNYLINIQRPIFSFLKNNNISKVFGEVTWAHEMLISRICRICNELDVDYLFPTSVRIPFDRFAFFRGESQKEIFVKKKNTVIPDIDFNFKAPDYLQRNNELLKKRFSFWGMGMRFWGLLFNSNQHDADDMTKRSTLKTICVKSREFFRYYIYHIFVSRSKFSDVGGNYIFYALHKQPESSIDVFGRYFEDQFTNILNLWRNLPPGWQLVVKEHTNAIGDRNFNFYRKIKKLSNVLLVNEREDSKKIIKNAQLVATVTGTVAYEASLMGIKSFTFAPCFFNGFSNCFHVSLSDFAGSINLKDLIEKLLAKQGNQDSSKLQESIMGNSYEGIISDPISFPSCMSSDNISKVISAFYQVI